MKLLLLCTLLFVLTTLTFAASCKKPSITSSYYIANDAVFQSHAAFVVEFIVKCQNEARDVPLFTEINGRLIPAAIALDSNRYQVSWTDEHSKTPAGTYKVNIHDEDGYNSIRKQQRNDADYSHIQPLHTINVEYKGAVKGPWIQSPMLALAFCLVLVYVAHSWKSQIMA